MYTVNHTYFDLILNYTYGILSLIFSLMFFPDSHSVKHSLLKFTVQYY